MCGGGLATYLDATASLTGSSQASSARISLCHLARRWRALPLCMHYCQSLVTSSRTCMVQALPQGVAMNWDWSSKRTASFHPLVLHRSLINLMGSKLLRFFLACIRAIRNGCKIRPLFEWQPSWQFAHVLELALSRYQRGCTLWRPTGIFYCINFFT